ncbi:MAG: cation:proton antiporter [Bdellovibrionaceae bacterium]|nr:cation:proton antiporter [Bdellovibrionales bacterium]MCB9085873.1 cation:proton antiporter [Pseudobdellovibrionaceae bacterium]
MNAGHQLLIDLIVILGSATLVATIFYSIHLPPVVGFLFAGILAGPNGLGLVKTLPSVEVLTEIAGVLLMFTIGLEISLRQLLAMKKVLFGLGLGQMALTMGLSALIFHFGFGFGWPRSVFFSSIVALSSTAVVLKLLKDSRNLDSPLGQTSLSILLFQDIAVIPLLLILPLLAGAKAAQATASPLSLETIGTFVLTSGGLILFVLVGSRWVVPWILDRVAKTRSSEIFFFSILFICAGTAFLIEFVGLSLSLGAFFAGLMIASSPYGKQTMAEFTPLRDNFLGLFFVSIGMLLSLQFVQEHWLQVIALSSGILLIKFFCIFAVLWMFGITSTVGMVTALTLFQIGEFSLILADQGRGLGMMTDKQYQFFLSVAIISLALTPVLYRLAPKLSFQSNLRSLIPRSISEVAHQLRDQWVTKVSVDSVKHGAGELAGHTIIIGFGIAGQEVASALKALDLPYQVIEMNPDTVKAAKKRGDPIIYGDATKHEILEQAGLERAHLVILVVNSLDITTAVLRTVHKMRPEIEVLARLQYLRDLNQLKASQNVEPIVSEFETSLEILARTLKAYGAEDHQIHQFTLDAHERLQKTSMGLARSHRISLNLPDWQMFASLFPMKIIAASPAIGQNLIQLDLRKQTGATIVSVSREGMGTTVPGPDFTFEANDTLYLLGTSDSIRRTEALIHPQS